MSYTVLARKWRPKNFQELVGQTHVQQALSNALSQNRLHHAYLFTGTRGVGKTTIARIFAKSLNCVNGVTATPCGQCAHCQAIDQGRFIDLIEVDAASKTKVDDTREILDNVQFAPTQGRYKVYLIDEVHMLSKSSFNALLKTLEEPPEHVKFLLATTDPHKLPITVLSRCLQFNLLRLSIEQISSHLAYVLTQEQLPFDEAALNLVAHSADGSMRDALSLLDQAIAFGGGEVQLEQVQKMLGLVDQAFAVRIVQALSADDGVVIRDILAELSALGVDYASLLVQLIELLHTVSYQQVLGQNAPSTGLVSGADVQALAQTVSAERVQMLYQIALLARQDIQLAPTVQIGFEMALLRMLAFVPVESVAISAPKMVSEVSASTSVSSSASTSPQIQQNAASSVPVQNEVLENIETPDLQEMSIKDAMAHMSSARNLIHSGKSKPKPEMPEEAPPEQAQEIESSQAAMNPDEAFLLGLESVGKPSETHDESQQQLDETPSTPSVEVVPESSNVTNFKRPERHNPFTAVKSQLQNVASEPMAEPIQAVANTSTEFQPEVSRTVSQAISQSQVVADESQSAPFDSVPPVFDAPLMQDYADEMPMESAPNWDVPPPFEPDIPFQESVQTPSMPPVPMPTEKVEIPQVVSNTESQTEVVSQPSPPLESIGNTLLDEWIQWGERAQLHAMMAEIYQHCAPLEKANGQVTFCIDPAQNFSHQQNAMQQMLEQVQHVAGLLLVQVSAPMDMPMTHSKLKQIQAEQRLQRAHQSIHENPMVKRFQNELGMTIVPNSIKPL